MIAHRAWRNDRGRGPWSITGLLVCSAVPVVLMAPLAGRLVDSMSFRTLAVSTGIWQAACCLGLAVAEPLAVIYLLVLALQAGQAVAGPTWQALLPSIAERDELGRAVSTGQALTTVAAVAAPAVAGLSVGLLGYGAPLLFDAATFLVLASAGLAIHATRGAAESPDSPLEDRGAQARVALRSDALLWPLIVGLCALVVVGEVTNVVEVFLLRGPLGASSAGFGIVAAVLAGGIVAGSMVAGGSRPDGARALRTCVAAIILALGLIVAGVAPTLPVFAAAWAVVGFTNGIVNADATTVLLHRIPDASRGRVLANVNAMIRGGSLGALALGGAAGRLLGPRATFVSAGALSVIAATLLLVRVRRALAGSALAASAGTARAVG
ncbi:MAG TPA: MFS transporter [Gaiellaceae bacterium]